MPRQAESQARGAAGEDAPPLPIDALTLVRSHPLAWARMVYPTEYDPAPHLRLLYRELLDVALGKTQRLVVEMPPRSGKSEATSYLFPSWYLGRWPDRDVILATYSAEKAVEWGSKARDLYAEWAPRVFGTSVAPGYETKKRWKTSRGGGMLSTGIGGPATGSGAHIFVVDDPFKNPQQAASPTYRAMAKSWYKGVAVTRLAPQAGMVINMARWDDDDLAGGMMKEWDENGLPYKRVRLPAIAEADPPPKTPPDALGRSPGEALWPKRYDATALRAKELELGPYLWNALYQQRPTPPGGKVFRRAWIRHYHVDGTAVVLEVPDAAARRYPISECEIFHTKDSAETTGERSAYSCIGTWLVTPENDLLLWDLQREREEVAELRIMCRATLRQHGGVLHIEKKSHGTALIQDLQHEGLPVVAFEPQGNKIVRARVAEARFSAGRVYLPARATWLADYLDELLRFPGGDYADQVDVTSHACIVLATRKVPRIR